MSNPLDDYGVMLKKFESKDYINSGSENLEKIKLQIIKFFTWFNEVARISLLKCNKKEEYLFLLLELKKQIKSSISALGNSPNGRKQEFICGVCDEKIIVKPWQDIWECFQNHSHFDQLCLNFLSRNPETQIDNIVFAGDNSNPHGATVSSVSGRLDKLFKNIDKLDTPLKIVHHCSDFIMSEEVMPYDMEIEVKSRQNQSRNGFELEEDSEISSDIVDVNLKSYEYGLPECEPKIEQSISTVIHPSIDNPSQLKTDQYVDVNSFLFKFDTKYSTTVEKKLYPSVFQKYNIDGYKVLQCTGSYRIVCLTCMCELMLNKNSTISKIVNTHVTGQKHLSMLLNPAVIMTLQSYHEVFLNFESNLQAHQVYFVPDNDSNLLKCILCKLFVKKHDVLSHILNEPHKENIMDLKGEEYTIYTFYLLDHQLQVYGIKYDAEQKKGPKKPSRYFYYAKNVEPKEHDIVKSVINPNDDNPLKTIPRRFDQHLKYLKKTGSNVTCIACKKGGSNIPKNKLKFHLIKSSHLESTKLELTDYKFYCEICDLTFHDEMSWHMHFERTPEKHTTMAASRREHVYEHECITCKNIIYGDEISLMRHRNSPRFKRQQSRRERFLPDITKEYFGSKSIINENGQKLLDDAMKLLNEPEHTLEICRNLEDALSEYFVHCKAHPFGSRISGLGNSDSDLDIFMDIGGMYDGGPIQSEQQQSKIISIAYDILKKNKNFYKVISRPTARTPIIRLKHRHLLLECDISFRHGLSVENTKFQRFCFELQPASQTLILLVKKWSHLCELNENITTYAMAMLAIFYLQTEYYLVSVNAVKILNPTESTVIDGWDTITYSVPIEKVRHYIKMYNEDIVHLLKGFFKYYSDFNYKEHVICPLLGQIVLKTEFSVDLKGKFLPEEMKSYKKKINTMESPEYFRSSSEFCIQDPFDLSHNLTKACSITFVEKFQRFCTLTYEMLEKL